MLSNNYIFRFNYTCCVLARILLCSIWFFFIKETENLTLLKAFSLHIEIDHVYVNKYKKAFFLHFSQKLSNSLFVKSDKLWNKRYAGICILYM
jgi:hypothetical protein